MTDVYNDTRAQELRRACECSCLNDMDRVRELILTTDLNQVFPDGCTALFVAAQHGKLEVVEMLLNHGASVNLGKASTGQTPLYIAAQNEHFKVVQKLLEFGADPNQETSDTGDTPLVVACELGNVAIVTALLNQQPNAVDVTKFRRSDRCPALVAAAMNGHLELVQQLLNKPGIQVNQTNLNGETALYHASYRWWTHIAEVLIRARADPNTATVNNGTTALMMAAQNGFYDIVLLLLQHDALVVDQQKPASGCTALYIVSLEGYLDVVQYLICAGANVNHARKQDDGTPILIAAERGHYEVVRELLSAGANPNSIRRRILKNGQVEIMSPLEMAALMGHINVVRTLLATGEMASESQIVQNALSIARGKALEAGAEAATFREIAELIASASQMPIARRPTFDRSPGPYSGSFELTLRCPSADAIIYYTLDGTIPSKENGCVYKSPIAIREKVTTVQAIAYIPEMEPSLVVKGMCFSQGQPDSVQRGSQAWAQWAAPLRRPEFEAVPTSLGNHQSEGDAEAHISGLDQISAVQTSILSVRPASPGPERPALPPPPHVYEKFSLGGIIFTRKQRLGQGGFGVVWLYEHSSGARYAVKYILYPTETDPHAAHIRAHIQREISVLEKLKHPNIVAHVKTIITRYYACMGMEYLPKSLAKLIEESGPVPLPKLKQYARQILSALDYLHSRNIIHQDLKPDNVLLDKDDNAKLVDFGVAVPKGSFLHKPYGTPAFMPPEAIVAPRVETDMWGFGLTVLMLFLGDFPPYYAKAIAQKDNGVTLKQRIVNAKYDVLTEGCKVSIPSDLESFLRRCLLGSDEWGQRARCDELLRHPFLQP